MWTQQLIATSGPPRERSPRFERRERTMGDRRRNPASLAFRLSESLAERERLAAAESRLAARRALAEENARLAAAALLARDAATLLRVRWREERVRAARAWLARHADTLLDLHLGLVSRTEGLALAAAEALRNVGVFTAAEHVAVADDIRGATDRVAAVPVAAETAVQAPPESAPSESEAAAPATMASAPAATMLSPTEAPAGTAPAEAQAEWLTPSALDGVGSPEAAPSFLDEPVPTVHALFDALRAASPAAVPAADGAAIQELSFYPSSFASFSPIASDDGTPAAASRPASSVVSDVASEVPDSVAEDLDEVEDDESVREEATASIISSLGPARAAVAVAEARRRHKAVERAEALDAARLALQNEVAEACRLLSAGHYPAHGAEAFSQQAAALERAQLLELSQLAEDAPGLRGEPDALRSWRELIRVDIDVLRELEDVAARPWPVVPGGPEVGSVSDQSTIVEALVAIAQLQPLDAIKTPSRARHAPGSVPPTPSDAASSAYGAASFCAPSTHGSGSEPFAVAGSCCSRAAGDEAASPGPGSRVENIEDLRRELERRRATGRALLATL